MTKDANQGFFKNHADTLAIIGVNIAIFALVLSICLSNISSIAAVNSRLDSLSTRLDATYQIIIDLLKEGRKQ